MSLRFELRNRYIFFDFSFYIILKLLPQHWDEMPSILWPSFRVSMETRNKDTVDSCRGQTDRRNDYKVKVLRHIWKKKKWTNKLKTSVFNDTHIKNCNGTKSNQVQDIFSKSLKYWKIWNTLLLQRANIWELSIRIMLKS